MTAQLRVRPVTGTLGAEIGNIDLADVSPEQFAQLDELIVDRKVLFFRDQHLTSAQQVEFGSHFGDVLDCHPWTPSKEGVPKVMVIRNVAATGWHSDETWRTNTPMGSVLVCREAPEFGGDTLFLDMESVYNDLDDAWKSKLSELTAVHDHIQHRNRMIQKGVPASQIEAWREEFPAIAHPIVRTHPVSGRKSLFVNRVFTSHVSGLNPEESQELLDWIYSRNHKPEHQCRFRWEANSVAFWDNRSVQHCGVADFGTQKRLMERVTIAGPKPQ